MDATKAIEELAKQRGLSTAQVRADMIVAIHQAFLAKKPEFTILFGDKEPSPEVFLSTVAQDFSGSQIQN